MNTSWDKYGMLTGHPGIFDVLEYTEVNSAGE
jgi:hypothetical protein